MKRMKYKNKSREELIEDNKSLEKFHYRYIRIMENARDMIYRMSLPDGNYEFVSPACKEIFGYEPKVFLETPVLIQKAIHPDFIQYFQDEWQKLLDGNVSPTYEYKIIHKSGEERWLNQRNVLVKNEEGKPIAIEGVVTDITKTKKVQLEKKELKHEIREKEKNLNCLYSIFDLSYDKLSIADFIKKVIDIIPAAFQYREVCAVKIKFKNQEYKSDTYKSTKWFLEEDIIIDNETIGKIEINYIKEMPTHFKGPFLEEELDLIGGISDIIGRNLESKIREHETNERAKELNCLYKISDYSFEDNTIEKFLNKVVKTIPPAFQYPEHCSAKITLHAKEYQTKNYKKSKWEIKNDIIIDNEQSGEIVINYQKKLPEHDQGPFLKEELDLINGIAELVSRTIDSKQKELELKEKNEEYLAINEELKEKNEEFLAVNEELEEKSEEYHSLYEEYLSQNEELHEQNEEFQAINEELEEEMAQRQQVQEELQKANEQQLALFDGIDDVIYVADPDTYEILYFNKAAKNTWGEDSIGKKCYNVLQNRNDPCPFCTNDKILGENTGKFYVWEFQNKMTKKWYRCADKAIKWSNGKMVRFELASDITELKQIQTNLMQSEKQFRSLFENSPLGKSMTGVDGSLRVNKAFCDILGYSEKEIQNTNWKDITHPDDIQESIDVVQTLLNGEKESAHYEKRYIHKKGHIVIADVNTSLLRGTDKKPQYFITTISDITERKQMQFKMENMLKELERSNKELEQFAYVASHDLQEPLRKVKNFAELFARKYANALDEKADQYIKYMTSGADRMQNLILDLLSFSRVATRGKEFVKTNLDDIVKHVEENLQLVIEEHNAKIVYDDLPILKVDESQIAQVFQNLISNAIKFKSDKDPIIKIEARDQKNYWQFSVTDNGIGMHMKYKERIFEVFQRLHTKEEYKGTGIGLAICKKIIERHHGKIWIDSKPGEGSTFYFTIPKKLK